MTNFEQQLYYWTHMLDESSNMTTLDEGDHWPEDYMAKTIKKIKASPIFFSIYQKNEEYVQTDAANIIKDFDPQVFDGHSHISNALISYYNVVISWFLKYSTNTQKYQQFLEMKLPSIVQALKDICNDKENEKVLRPQIKKMSFEQFEELVKTINQQNQDDESSQLKSQSFDGVKQYDVIPIESYQQFNQEFGGKWTGLKGKGNWCHANGQTTFDDWTMHGDYAFYVIAKPNWKQIECPDNPVDALDEYGSSLVALLVNTTNGRLEKSTLRYNHECERPGRTADSAFKNWADLNSFCKQDIRSEIVGPLEQKIQQQQQLSQNANAEVARILQANRDIFDNTIPNDVKAYVTEITIPSNVKFIRSYAFHKCSRLEKIDIPNTVLQIGEFAFKDCHNLKSIKIPESITKLRRRIFEKCTSLEHVELPYALAAIEEAPFYMCDGLHSIELPDSVVSIEPGTFARCLNLKNIKLPNSMQYIPQAMFADCQSLPRLNIPSSVTNIGSYAFAGCVKLEELQIPDSVTTIQAGAFAYCMNMQRIKMSNNVTQLTYDVFKKCDSLNSLDIPASVTNVESSAIVDLHHVIVHSQDLANRIISRNPNLEVEVQLQTTNESGKYSRKQLLEAIQYWSRILDEAYD